MASPDEHVASSSYDEVHLLTVLKDCDPMKDTVIDPIFCRNIWNEISDV